MGILILLIIACALSMVLYRAGGMGDNPKAKPEWIPKWLRFDKARDAFCPLVLLVVVLLVYGINLKHWLAYLIFYAASWGALSTYWDFTGKDNFYLHGLGCSLATAPLYWVGVPWWILLIHAIICTVGMGLWSSVIDTDYIEEEGRGVLYII